MCGGGTQHLGLVAPVGVDGARDEARVRAQRQGEWVEGMVLGAEGRRLRDLPLLAGRRVLALGEPVDLVVEEQDVDRHVAPQRVDQVVAADRERVAVAGHDPDREIRAGEREPRGDGRGAAVDAVHPVGAHVIGEPARAADAGDEDDLLGRDPHLGEELLDGRQDGVVAAARAPAGLLIGGEVLLGQRQGAAAAASGAPPFPDVRWSRS